MDHGKNESLAWSNIVMRGDSSEESSSESGEDSNNRYICNHLNNDSCQRCRRGIDGASGELATPRTVDLDRASFMVAADYSGDRELNDSISIVETSTIHDEIPENATRRNFAHTIAHESSNANASFGLTETNAEVH